MTKYEMVGQHHQLNGQEFEQALGDGEGEGSLVCRSPRGRRIYMTDQLNNNVDSHPVIFSFLFCFNNFIYLFMAVLGLHFCLGFSLGWESSCGGWASHCSGFLVADHRLQGKQASVPVAHGFSSCSSWAHHLWHMSLVGPQYTGSFWIRDQTYVFCMGSRILCQ